MDQPFAVARRHPRFEVDLTVVCTTAMPRLADRAVNLSYGGARIRTAHPLPSSSHHHFLFIVPNAEPRDTVIEVTATVVWASDDAMGLRFDRAGGDVSSLLDRLARLSR